MSIVAVRSPLAISLTKSTLLLRLRAIERASWKLKAKPAKISSSVMVNMVFLSLLSMA
ncbi:MAG: hypothetical protein BWY87_01228 [Deltaproteobacteria bacterium ADurb.Bin510]|nr:MAG: hypothetical protein BWY87_01228 [Deltaproteobacteria bacterium ADurb.Bin510]